MATWVCDEFIHDDASKDPDQGAPCGAVYAVDAPSCPQCGGTAHHEAGAVLVEAERVAEPEQEGSPSEVDSARRNDERPA